jgi:NADH:ubiquinone oxidoreductase subunit C
MRRLRTIKSSRLINCLRIGNKEKSFMSQRYTFPTHIFLIFEKTSTVVWTSSTLAPQNFVMLLQNAWLYPFCKLLKKDLNTRDLFIVDNSVFILNDVNNWMLQDSILYKQAYLNVYLFYIYTLKLKLLLLVSNNTLTTEFTSIDSLFINASWLERESSEMYGIFFRIKKDNRKLLLDYSRTEYPLRKDFSSEGYMDCFYSIFENDVVYLNNDVIEL